MSNQHSLRRRPRRWPVPKVKKTSTAAPVGYEAQLWQMADALRGSMDAAEYKHVVLGRRAVSKRIGPSIRRRCPLLRLAGTGFRSFESTYTGSILDGNGIKNGDDLSGPAWRAQRELA